MGQLNQKAKLNLKSIGVTGLPERYQKDENNYLYLQGDQVRLRPHYVMLNPTQVEQYVEMLRFRRNYPDNFIQIRYLSIRKQQRQYCKLVVYTQRIIVTLEQLMNINFNDMIRLIYLSLKGFMLLFERFKKYFTIESFMMGINDLGQVKVWFDRKVTEHFAKNSYSYKKVSKSQASMIEQIKQIFYCKVNKITVPQNFALKSTSFSSLIKELQQKFGTPFFINNFNSLKNLAVIQSCDSSLKGSTVSLSNIIDQRPQRIENRFSSNINGPMVRFNNHIHHSINTNSAIASNKVSQVIQPVRNNSAKITFNGKSVSKNNIPISVPIHSTPNQIPAESLMMKNVIEQSRRVESSTGKKISQSVSLNKKINFAYNNDKKRSDSPIDKIKQDVGLNCEQNNLSSQNKSKPKININYKN